MCVCGWPPGRAPGAASTRTVRGYAPLDWLQFAKTAVVAPPTRMNCPSPLRQPAQTNKAHRQDGRHPRGLGQPTTLPPAIPRKGTERRGARPVNSQSRALTARSHPGGEHITGPPHMPPPWRQALPRAIPRPGTKHSAERSGPHTHTQNNPESGAMARKQPRHPT